MGIRLVKARGKEMSLHSCLVAAKKTLFTQRKKFLIKLKISATRIEDLINYLHLLINCFD